MIKNNKQLKELFKNKTGQKLKIIKVKDGVLYKWTLDNEDYCIIYTKNKKVYDENSWRKDYIHFTKEGIYKKFEEILLDIRDITPKFNVGDIVYIKGNEWQYNTISQIIGIEYYPDCLMYKCSNGNLCKEKHLLLKK